MTIFSPEADWLLRKIREPDQDSCRFGFSAKILVISVYTDGSNNTKNLGPEAALLSNYAARNGLHSIVLNLNELHHIGNEPAFYASDYTQLVSTINPNLLPRGIRMDWCRVGLMQFKPFLLSAICNLLQDRFIYIYIDCDITRYPTYPALLGYISVRLDRLLAGKSIMLFFDSVHHICASDIKPSLFKKASVNIFPEDLSCWAGCIVFAHSLVTTRVFRRWCQLSVPITNLLPNERANVDSRFIYHAQEQSTLTLAMFENMSLVRVILLLGSRRMPALLGELKFAPGQILSILRRTIPLRRKLMYVMMVIRSVFRSASDWSILCFR
jgi:hypothetical protein